MQPLPPNFNTHYIQPGEYLIGQVGQYFDSSPALDIISTEGEPIARVTVMVDVPPTPGCIWVKSYSENEGMRLALTEAGLIGPVTAIRATGFVEVTEHEWLGNPLKEGTTA